jgi:uncharacterized protein YjbJ (UPF0337 family)
MGEGTFDDVKGRAKEAAGALTDDEELEREGKIDQAVGKVKDKVGDAADKAQDLAGDVADKVKGALDRD